MTFEDISILIDYLQKAEDMLIGFEEDPKEAVHYIQDAIGYIRDNCSHDIEDAGDTEHSIPFCKHCLWQNGKTLLNKYKTGIPF